MDESVFTIARKRIQIELDEQRHHLEEAIETIRRAANARGMLQSGNTLITVADACAKAATERADIVWRVLYRTATTVGIEHSESLELELKGFVNEYLPPDLPDLKQRAVGEINRLGMQRNIKDELLSRVERGRTVGVGRAHNEIELFVAQLKVTRNPADSRPAVVISNYGPVGAIMTGNNASAYLSQPIDPELMAKLTRGLEALQEAIARLDTLPMPKEEVAEIVAEAWAESTKANPNKMKLKSLLDTVGAAIRTVKDLKDVGEMLRPALQYFGVDV